MKILYCIDKKSKRKLPLKFPKASDIKDIYKSDHPVVVFDEKFLKKRKNLKVNLLSKKACLIHFLKEEKSNLKLVKQLKFFDYFTDQDSKSDINFKLKRAHEFSQAKHKVDLLQRSLLKRDEKIEKITLLDPLTGCYNWRYFLNRVHEEIEHSRRQLQKVSFVAVDIDNFRQISGIYGLKVIDQITKELVDLIKGSLRKEDIISRWRGDEFFIIMPNLDGKDVYAVAKRIRERISLNKFRYKNVSLTLKASVGVVSSPQDKVFNTRDVISALHKCINSAKRKGGDNITLYSQSRFKKMFQRKKETYSGNLREKIDKMNVLLTRDLLEMIYGFARAIEAKDSYTGAHVEYTANIAEKIAKSLRLPRNDVENIKHAAVLHDLGKVGIEENILSKKGKLTAKEKNIIKSHPSIAAEILREIHALRGSIPAVLYHHERYDGKGYPLGLKGEEIPLSARIVSVADVYQALTSDRPYRKAYSKKRALGIIKKESGKQFDPKLVKIFLKIIDKVDEKG